MAAAPIKPWEPSAKAKAKAKQGNRHALKSDVSSANVGGAFETNGWDRRFSSGIWQKSPREMVGPEILDAEDASQSCLEVVRTNTEPTLVGDCDIQALQRPRSKTDNGDGRPAPRRPTEFRRDIDQLFLMESLDDDDIDDEDDEQKQEETGHGSQAMGKQSSGLSSSDDDFQIGEGVQHEHHRMTMSQTMTAKTTDANIACRSSIFEQYEEVLRKSRAYIGPAIRNLMPGLDLTGSVDNEDGDDDDDDDEDEKADDNSEDCRTSESVVAVAPNPKNTSIRLEGASNQGRVRATTFDGSSTPRSALRVRSFSDAAGEHGVQAFIVGYFNYLGQIACCNCSQRSKRVVRNVQFSDEYCASQSM